MKYIIKNKSNTIRVLSLLGFFILILFSGCRKDRVTEDPSDPTFPTPGTMIESRLEGMINDETGLPMEGVTITVEGESATTDDDGFFRFSALSLNSTGSVVTSTKDGYIDGIKTVYPHLKEASYMELTLVKINTPSKFTSGSGGTITTSGNGTIEFAPDGIVLKSGGSFNGEVEVYTHWYDPADPNTPVSMPGNLEGRDEDGARFQLQTFGMLYVDLKAPDGRSLQLADGKEATIKFPTINASTAPTTLPLWSFDEVEGIWVKEGEATLDGDQYVGQVSHFSFWNCDYNFPLVTIEGRVVDEATGNPIANQGVAIRVNQWTGGYGYTNSAGIFKGKVPKDQPLELVIWDCGVLLVQQSLGALPADENLGDFEVTLTDFAFPITGKMVGCVGETLPQAYGIIHRKLVTSAPDGTFNTITSGCGQSTIVGTFSNPVEQSINKGLVKTTDQNMEHHVPLNESNPVSIEHIKKEKYTPISIAVLNNQINIIPLDQNEMLDMKLDIELMQKASIYPIKQNKIALDLSLGGGISQRIFTTTKDSPYDIRKTNETSLEFLNTALGMRYNFNRNWYGKLSIDYSRYSERYRFNAVEKINVKHDSIPTLLEIDLKGDTIVTIAPGEGTQLINTRWDYYNYYHSINVPVKIGFHMPINKLGLLVEAGPIINLGFFQDVNILNEQGVTTHNPDTYKSNIGLGFETSLGMTYKINNTFIIYSAPSFRYNFSNTLSSTALGSHKLSSFYLKFGSYINI